MNGGPTLQPHLTFLGFGFVAKALTRALDGQNFRLSAIVRTRRADEEARFPQVKFLDWTTGTDPAITAAISGSNHIVSSVPPRKEGDPAMQLLAPLLDELPALKWLALLATTGPYGDRGGAWVDETAKIAPDHIRASLRARQELDWLDLGQKKALPVHIFRLSGIYGPGRSAFDKLRRGSARRIIKRDQVFSRIHVDDIAQTLIASMARPNPGAIYNLADDLPAPPQDVIEFAANLLGLPVPPDEDFATAEISPMARSFYADNRRVANAKIKSELGIRLRYPDYKTGLRAILAQES